MNLIAENFHKLTPDRLRMICATALAQDEQVRTLVAERIAFRLVESTNCYRRRHFFVLDDHKAAPFARHWNYKNICGVSFARDEADEARAWVKQALLASFRVFYSHRRYDAGAGCGLEDGIYGEDGGWLCRELEARGIEP